MASVGVCAPVHTAALALPTGSHCAEEYGEGDIGTPTCAAAAKPITAGSLATSGSLTAAVAAGMVLLTNDSFFCTSALVKYLMMSSATFSCWRSTAFLVIIRVLMPTNGLPTAAIP